MFSSVYNQLKIRTAVFSSLQNESFKYTEEAGPPLPQNTPMSHRRVSTVAQSGQTRNRP